MSGSHGARESSEGVYRRPAALSGRAKPTDEGERTAAESEGPDLIPPWRNRAEPRAAIKPGDPCSRRYTIPRLRVYIIVGRGVQPRVSFSGLNNDGTTGMVLQRNCLFGEWPRCHEETIFWSTRTV